MWATLIAMGAGCLVFLVFLFVMFCKDRRERTTGIRAGCQHHQEGRDCHCQGQIAPHPPDADAAGKKGRAR